METNQTPAASESWTPEPWVYQANADVYTHILRGPDNCYVAGFSQMANGRSKADALRAAKCVNALEGVADPEKELARLRGDSECLQKLQSVAAINFIQAATDMECERDELRSKLRTTEADAAAMRAELRRISKLKPHIHETEGGCAYIAESALATGAGAALLTELEALRKESASTSWIIADLEKNWTRAQNELTTLRAKVTAADELGGALSQYLMAGSKDARRVASVRAKNARAAWKEASK